MITRIDDSIFIHAGKNIRVKWQPLRTELGLLAFYADNYMIHFLVYLDASQDIVEMINPYAVSMDMIVDSYNAVIHGIEEASYFNSIEIGTYAREHCVSLTLDGDKLTFSFWTSKYGDYAQIDVSVSEWVTFLKMIKEKVHIYD